MSKDHLAIFPVDPLWDADLAETPAIELTGKRGELGVTEEERKEGSHKLFATSDNEGTAVLGPASAWIPLAGLRLLSINMREHQHELKDCRQQASKL